MTIQGWIAATALAAGVWLASGPWAVAQPSAHGDPLVEVGRRIYQAGQLPDGSPLRATRPEGFVLEGQQAACVICHRESGMGSVEGSLERTILVPPVAGPVLFAPARFSDTFLDYSHHWVPNEAWARALTRSAYDEKRLARALREGLDPDGTPLVTPMPRYDLDDGALSALAAYLHRLAAEPAPGVEPNALHLATVVTPDAPPGQAEAVVDVLRAWSATAQPTGVPWVLHLWELSGPPEHWQAQLESSYRERPVFAVLSGVGGAEWGPVHRFCEANNLPCVLPALEVAPERDGTFYPLYFSPGVTLEARILAAHWLAQAEGSERTVSRTPEIRQLYLDESGRRAAEALTSTLGADAGVTRMQRFRPTAPAAGLDSMGPDSVLVLWLRPEAIEQLVAAIPEGPPGTIVLSELLAPPGTLRLPPAWKRRLTYVSLFDDLGLQSEIARLRLRRWLGLHGLEPAADLRPQADAYAAAYLFTSALGEIRGQELRRPPVPLIREHLLEMLEQQANKYADGTDVVDPDGHVAFYGRMSLGPRQRTAVRGGALLRFAAPDSDRLVAASDRIVP